MTTASMASIPGSRASGRSFGDVSLPGTSNGSRINTVTYKNATIKAMIDPSLRVSDVIRQLCANAHLGVQEPPALFALRDETDDELIDDTNMSRKIEAGRNFKLCSSPTIEAVEVVDKLSSRDERILKMATHSLQKLIREKPFSNEFLKRGGFEELMNIIMSLDGGNTLAYTLTSVQNLIESCDEGWETLDSEFIRKVVNILTTQERINVCRPATAILKKLVVSGPQDAPIEQGNIVGDTDLDQNTDQGNAMQRATSQEARKTRGEIPSTYRYGFDVIYAEIRKEPTFLQTLTQRLSSADTTLCMYSLSLINSLMRNASDTLFDAFTSELERLGVSKAVARLMDSTRGDELASSILEYQMNVIRVAHHRMRTLVTPTDKRHVGALSYIWLQARIPELTQEEEEGGTIVKYKWRRLGFENENVAKDFARAGWLGLECCEHFVRTDPEQYAKIILEQINRPEQRRCPWGAASLEVVEILADHYDIASGYSTATQFQPLLLSFTRLHYLALRFFLRMWSESGASISDFGRVSALVRSQVKEALRDESSKSMLEVESDFLESAYRDVRDRQMRELEVGDDFSNKTSIRNLRGRMYRESYEFVRQQRIQCLLEGAWFRNPASNATFSMVGGPTRNVKGSLTMGANGIASSRPYRFYRLSPNKKYLYFCEASEKVPIRSGLDDLPERIDLSLVRDILIHSTAQNVNSEGNNAVLNGGTIATNNGMINVNEANNNLAFSLLRAPDVSLADFVALNTSQFSEWTDGLSMLSTEGGLVNTRETAEFIQILTDIGVKVKLLDVTGEQVELPSAVAPPHLPSSTSFFFADL
ncbi:hypothetical protein L7F22_039174 [Adiantum nelumboides]|nr:hypothetical protein [Adiantum nelumboides]